MEVWAARRLFESEGFDELFELFTTEELAKRYCEEMEKGHIIESYQGRISWRISLDSGSGSSLGTNENHSDYRWWVGPIWVKSEI